MDWQMQLPISYYYDYVIMLCNETSQIPTSSTVMGITIRLKSIIYNGIDQVVYRRIISITQSQAQPN